MWHGSVRRTTFPSVPPSYDYHNLRLNGSEISKLLCKDRSQCTELTVEKGTEDLLGNYWWWVMKVVLSFWYFIILLLSLLEQSSTVFQWFTWNFSSVRRRIRDVNLQTGGRRQGSWVVQQVNIHLRCRSTRPNLKSDMTIIQWKHWNPNTERHGVKGMSISSQQYS